jgi:ATP-dependent Lon protease
MLRPGSLPLVMVVMVGNFDVDVAHDQRVGHLFGPMPPEMRNDTALMDRIHLLPAGLGRAEISEGIKTNHFGLVSDFISECWTRGRKRRLHRIDASRCPEATLRALR